MFPTTANESQLRFAVSGRPLREFMSVKDAFTSELKHLNMTMQQHTSLYGEDLAHSPVYTTAIASFDHCVAVWRSRLVDWQENNPGAFADFVARKADKKRDKRARRVLRLAASAAKALPRIKQGMQPAELARLMGISSGYCLAIHTHMRRLLAARETNHWTK